MNAIECTITCLKNSQMFIPSILISVGFFVSILGYLVVRDSMEKLRFYWFANVLALVNMPVLFLSMSCDMVLFIKLYLGYAGVTIATLLVSPFLYKIYLKRRIGFKRDEELERLVNVDRVNVLNTSLPKAFTLGNEIFISAGMLDLLETQEIKAVLAHEKFHVLENKTPLVSRLKYLTFLPISQSKIEIMADEYAKKIAGKESLEMAKRKIDEFYA